MENKELNQTAKTLIIQKGVSNLKEFGYENVDINNIFTDAIYSQMFKRILENNKGEDNRIDTIIDEIILDISDNR
jgi:hypothetical protein